MWSDLNRLVSTFQRVWTQVALNLYYIALCEIKSIWFPGLIFKSSSKMRHVCVQVKLDLIYANPESAPKLKMNSISIQVDSSRIFWVVWNASIQ